MLIQRIISVPNDSCVQFAVVFVHVPGLNYFSDSGFVYICQVSEPYGKEDDVPFYQQPSSTILPHFTIMLFVWSDYYHSNCHGRRHRRSRPKFTVVSLWSSVLCIINILSLMPLCLLLCCYFK